MAVNLIRWANVRQSVMPGTLLPEHLSELDDGDVVQYTKRRLFDGKIDTLDSHIERKKALAEPTRYSILYLLYEYGEISRVRLAAETDRTSNHLQHHLNELLDTNLIAEIPAPEDADGRQTYYRITTLGKLEISSDIEQIVGGNAHENRFRALGDPELVDGLSETGSRIRTLEGPNNEIKEELDNRRRYLRDRRRTFQNVSRE